MLYFRACPRCQTGTIEYNSDSWGQYLQCLMCGYQRDMAPGTNPLAEIATARRQLAVVPVRVDGETAAA